MKQKSQKVRPHPPEKVNDGFQGGGKSSCTVLVQFPDI